MREIQYESPKRGSGKPLRSEWLTETDTAARAHLEGKGWQIVGMRERADAAPGLTVQPLPGERVAELPVQEVAPPLEDSTAEEVELTAVGLGVTDAQLQALIVAGYDTEGKLRAASDEQLRAVDGVSPAVLRNLRKALVAQ